MYHAFAEACYSVPDPRGNGVKWTGVTIVPANRAAQLARVEPQYLDLVDYITAHPDEVLSPHTYLAWPKRDTSIEWVSGSRDITVERAIMSRLSTLSAVSSLPVRPSIPSPYRRSVWLAALLDVGGAFYHTGHQKSASYVLDTGASWRRRREHVELVNNRWQHTPGAEVRKLLPTPVYPPNTPEVPETAAVALDSVDVATPSAVTFDPTPDQLRVAANAAFTNGTSVSLASATYTVQAAGQHVGDQLVVRVDTPDGASALLIANVATILPVVGS